MIIAKIKQSGQVITLEDKLTTFQYSANLQMQFVRDNRYKDYILTGWYKRLKGEEYLLDIQDDGIFTLGKDIFAKQGSVYFSFSLSSLDGEIIHLGVIEYTVEQSFGSGDAILSEEQDTWIQVVSSAARETIEEDVNFVKEKAIESFANAQNALDSANTALEAEEKALEHMSNAEKFKNDASSSAQQADSAKTEASKSAKDASNSATSALDSSNKAKEHLDNVTEKVNVFNADYTEKVNSFNSNAEKANNTLDTKIADANTSIDGKVNVATEQANIATSKATELKDAVDKVNYLEDALDTKLTQPYVSSFIIENGTISDSDEGLLRNLKIYGKCTQKVETDIVPTPSRPVPITSKKIIADGEVVELRSLKESVNLWDSRLMNYRVNNDLEAQAWGKSLGDPNLLNLKPNTTYTCTCTIEMLENIGEGLTVFDLSKRVMLYRIGSNDYGLPAYSGFIIYDRNEMQNGDIVENKYTFTTPNDLRGLELLIYTERYLDANNKAYFSKVAFRDIVLVEGTTVPTSYIAPAIRDYKIVDHVNKKARIERNVESISVNLSTVIPKSFQNEKNEIMYRYDTMHNQTNSYIQDSRPGLCNIAIYRRYDNDPSEHYYIGSTLSFFSYFNSISNIANVLCPLKTPVIEEIPYLENDQSEFGVSSQDSTSPSPTIKSEIEKVTELNIKSCSKNLFDMEKASNPDIWEKPNTYHCLKLDTSISEGNEYTVSFNADTKGRPVWIGLFGSTNNAQDTIKTLIWGKSFLGKIKSTFTARKTTYISIYWEAEGTVEENFTNIYSSFQIERGDTATTYEPYQETAVTHTLENPLLSLADGSVKDVITLKNRLNLLGIYTFTGTESFEGDYQGQPGYYGRYFIISNARGNIAQKVSCNALSFASGSWNLAQESFCQNANQLHLKFSNLRLGIKDDTSIADKQRAFSNYIKEQYDNGTPIEFLYILENPTIEPLEDGLIEKLKTLMSFYPITHIISNVPIKFDYKLNMPAWHKVVSGQVEDAKDIIYNMQVQQNNLEVMQLESALETQYNLDLLKLGGM